jgi:raffinose/stachyose/melibiose transport system substrate-binding protein
MPLAFAACSGQDNNGSGDNQGGGDDVTITVAMMNGSKPGLDAAIELFEAGDPGFEVDAIYYESGDAFTAAVTTQFASGNGTDLVQLIGGRGAPYAVGPFVEAGYLLDLSDQPWVDSMYEETKSLYTVDDKIYALEVGLSPLALLSYNKDIFADNGLTIPTTFDELLSTCEAISSNTDLIAISFAAGSAAVDANNMVVVAGNTVFSKDPDWLDKRLAGETTFADSGWRRAFEQLQEMIDGGCFSPGTAALQMPEMISEYASGEAAMMFTYGGQNGRVKQQTPEINIGMFPFPGDEVSDTRLTPQSAGGLGAWISTKHPDQVREFLDFLAGPEGANAFASNNFLITGAQATTGDMPEDYVDLEPYFKNGLAIPDASAWWPNTAFRDEFGAVIQGVFTGQATVDSVLADADRLFDAG